LYLTFQFEYEAVLSKPLSERAYTMADHDANDATEGLSPELMGQLLEQLQTDEASSQASTLESLDSLQNWMTNHPALRQMAVVEHFADIGPSILSFLRLMLGYPSGDPASGDDATGEPDIQR
jgi:hypothetical protein